MSPPGVWRWVEEGGGGGVGVGGYLQRDLSRVIISRTLGSRDSYLEMNIPAPCDSLKERKNRRVLVELPRD